jgi:hypothetical protein
MATDRPVRLAVLAAAALLLWPALWNGYPIVFADTGTYLSQAINHYAGWDRPVFYSLFMLPLHATVTVWPVVAAQGLLTVWVLRVVCRALLPTMPEPAFVGGTALLAACTWLPWIVSELMPDVFTPLLILVVCLLAWVPQRLSRRERAICVGLAAFMIATHQSSLPLACGLLAVLGVLSGPVMAGAGHRGRALDGAPPRPNPCPVPHRWVLLVLPPALALLALCSANLAAHGRFAISPFGNVFLLARVIYDGPGMDTLRRDCPSAHWRLCPYRDAFPPTSDDFLWAPGSPLFQVGGAKSVSQDVEAIIRATLAADPLGEARAAWSNTQKQLTAFASGDGLNPWPTQVSPWIKRDFPARETAAYASARQQAGTLAVAPPLAALHMLTSVAGVVGCVLLLPVAFIRRAPCFGFLLAVLIALPVSAAITGSLSAPHDRYQSRIMWLPPFMAVVSLISLRTSRRVP